MTEKLILPKRLKRNGKIKTLKIVEENGRRIANVLVELSSGKTVKTRIKNKTLLASVLTMEKKNDFIFIIETLKGQTNWLVAIKET